MAKEYTLRKDNYKVEITSNLKQRIDYEKVLNESQLRAVFSTDGSYLLIAGAGSGKTRTLTYRTARLIELGYNPTSIVLLTFTRKAAKEMLDRASALLDERCSKILGGTFHSFSYLLLRQYGNIINLDKNFTILDQQDSIDILGMIRNELVSKNSRFPQKDTLQKIYSYTLNTGTSIEDYLLKEYPHFYHLTNEIEKLFIAYQNYKIENNVLDYDDLLKYTVLLLNSNDKIADNFLKSLSFIMIDEYQDTNHLQALITKALAKFNNNVMAVGDDSQSIYSFRGANFKNIMEFPQLFPKVQIIKLQENYRSPQEILDFSNEIIRNLKYKYPKVLHSNKKGKEKPAIIPTKNEQEQSEFIVNRILDLLDEGVNLNEIAVLIRSAYFSYDLELELQKKKIPFQKIGGIKFVEAAHIKDVLAFLKTSVNIKDVLSFSRILKLLNGIGHKKANQIISVLNFDL
jgi:DNA helicase-2/ATP-dependent DNA helicase PcrA